MQERVQVMRHLRHLHAAPIAAEGGASIGAARSPHGGQQRSIRMLALSRSIARVARAITRRA